MGAHPYRRQGLEQLHPDAQGYRDRESAASASSLRRSLPSSHRREGRGRQRRRDVRVESVREFVLHRIAWASSGARARAGRRVEFKGRRVLAVIRSGWTIPGT